MDDPFIAYSFFGDLRSRPVATGGTWGQLRERFSDPQLLTEKTAGNLYCLTHFLEQRRANKNVTRLFGCVLDIDHGSEEQWRSLSDLPWRLFAYTSWSHVTGKKPWAFRVVVPFLEPCPPERWRDVWLHVANESGLQVDQQCKDPAHIFFFPSLPVETAERKLSFTTYENKTQHFFDWSSVPETSRVQISISKLPDNTNDFDIDQWPWDVLEKDNGWEIQDPCPVCLTSPASADGAEARKGFVTRTGRWLCQREKCPAALHHGGLPYSSWSRRFDQREDTTISLKEAEKTLSEALRASMQLALAGGNSLHVIDVPPGVGKSREAIRLLTQEFGAGTVIAANHGLLRQHLETAKGFGLQDYTYYVPLDHKEGGESLCQRYDALQAHISRRWPARYWVCKGGASRQPCPFQGSCKAYEGKIGPGGGIHFLTWSMLQTLSKDKLATLPRIVVVDELPDPVEELRMPRQELEMLQERGEAGTLGDWYPRHGKAALRGLLDPSSIRLPDSCPKPEFTGGLFLRADNDQIRGDVFEWLAEAGSRRATFSIQGDDYILYRARVKLPPSRRVILLDATSRHWLPFASQLFPDRLVEQTQIRVQDQATQRFVQDTQWVRSRIGSEDLSKIDEQLSGVLTQNLVSTSVGIVTWKKLVDAYVLGSLPKTRELLEKRGVAHSWLYYGYQRGRNDLEHVDQLILVGEPFPNINVAYLHAQALGLSGDSYTMMLRDLEVEQALGRARTVRRPHVTVTFVGKINPFEENVA